MHGKVLCSLKGSCVSTYMCMYVFRSPIRFNADEQSDRERMFVFSCCDNCLYSHVLTEEQIELCVCDKIYIWAIVEYCAKRDYVFL